jgi:hypothetical protein
MPRRVCDCDGIRRFILVELLGLHMVDDALASYVSIFDSMYLVSAITQVFLVMISD